MTDEEIEQLLRREWPRAAYTFKILEIIRRKRFSAIVIFYKVRCHRDGATEYRCKGWGNAAAGWDYVTRRKF